MLLDSFRQPNLSIRSLTFSILVFFLFTSYAPSAMAIKTGIEHEQQQDALNHKTTDQRYSKYLVEMKGKFKEAERLYDEQDSPFLGKLTDIKNAIQNGGSIFRDDDRWKEALNDALALKAKADALHNEVVEDFEKDADIFKGTKLPKSFLKQHSNDVALLKDRYQQFDEQVDSVTKTSDEDKKIEKLKALNTLLNQWQFGRKHQYADKEQLGNFTPTTAKDKPIMMELSDAWDEGIDSNPHVLLAALEGFDFSTLPSANDPAYLAETDEIVLTQAIKDKAKELEYKPVEINNWVRNNIDFVPGWGAYQSAELTLEAKRGNAMDIASLEIALLRASGVPARYVLGVAEIPAERYTNWMGNFKNADVASDYAVMNGIPTQVVTGGGKITLVRTQHVWVEVAVDYFPSRGVINIEADGWYPIDASFKQYDYQQGLDVVDIAGLDSQAMANQFINSGTVDDSEGYVQNLDSAQLLATQQVAQDKLQEHIDKELTDPTVGDVIGGRSIIPFNPRTLAGSPYRKVAKITTFGELPDNLQHRVALGFGDDRVIMPMAQLNNQKITLSFKPATATDEQALEALLPSGSITDINQLPSFIPSSIRVIPELALNGEVFKTGSALRVGNEVDMSYQVYSPIATYAPYKYSVIAGSYLNIPVMGQVVSQSSLIDVQDKIIQTQETIESNDQSQINNLNRENLLGDLFHSGGLGYFAEYESLSRTVAIQKNGSHKFEIGYGSYGYEPEVNTFFGIPRGIKAGGAAFNIRVGRSVQSFDGDKDARNNLRFNVGLISSTLEHAIPEQMFSDPNNPTNGVSAVKALQLATQQGQRIYQIDRSNVNSALANVSLDSSVESEIRSVVQQGHIVITHTNNINASGWIGSGYIILDSEVMDGSYKISGGINGGFWSGFLVGFALSLFAAIAIFPFLAPFLAIIGTMIATGGFVAGLNAKGGLGAIRCFALGLSTGIVAGAALIGLIAVGGGAALKLTKLAATADILTLIGVIDTATGGKLLNYNECIK